MLLWARTLEYRANNLSYISDTTFTELNEFVNKIIEKLDWSISHSELNFTKTWIEDAVEKVKMSSSIKTKREKKNLYKEVILSSNKAISCYINMLNSKIAFTKLVGN